MIEQTALVIDATKASHELRSIKDEKVIGPMDYGFHYGLKEDAIILGRGLLAGSHIPGTHRMIVVAYSKQWDHFYDSTMGGAAYVMLRLGVNYIHIKGKAKETSILKLNRVNGELKVELVPVDVETIWKGYKDEIGFYALQQKIFDTYKDEFKECRVIATGPAAKYSRSGALGSAPIEKGEVTAVDCWAGRGGMGSQLFQDHGIAGIIYGGEEMIRDERLTDRKKVDELFQSVFEKKMMPEDIAATEKYRYDEKFHTGGTFGVNFKKIRGEIFCYNYRSVNWTEEKRVALHKEFILNHYLEQFNKETINPKYFKHCGEPCPAVCKKMRGPYKKDYEPYQTLGPNSGIFDQRAAELINYYADGMGIDTIQVGIYVAWIFDCLDQGLFPPEDFGLSGKPVFSEVGFDVVKDSMHNAELGIEIIKMILFSEVGAPFREGIRVAAKNLAEKYGRKVLDSAVYNAHGKKGCMVANQYWTPGMYSPMPLMGKYCTSYGLGYMPPREIGRRNVERMILELYSDNGGLCRFHRKWIEKIFPLLVNTLYGENIDFYAHHKKLAQLINLNNEPVFWETERLLDLMRGYLKRYADDDDAKEWLRKFEEDKWKAAKEYWDELLAGQNEGFK